jgi:hypothetical protein
VLKFDSVNSVDCLTLSHYNKSAKWRVKSGGVKGASEGWGGGGWGAAEGWVGGGALKGGIEGRRSAVRESSMED